MAKRLVFERAAALAASILLGSIPALAQDLPQSVAEATRMERATALPIERLYATPLAAGKSKPGDLLAHESFGGYALPTGVTAVRIIYHSRDADGQDVDTSAVVLIPSGPTPKDGWPIIAWAHGTSGVAQQCAPSLMKDLYYGDEGLFAFLSAGFAVVATDYHGLGTPGPHQYVDKIAQVYRDLPSTSILRPDWDNNKWVQRYFGENALGEKPVGGPLFVIAGEADTTVPIDGVRTLVHSACSAGTAVTFRSYPGLDHDPTMVTSVPDQLAWIKDRFAGKPAGRSCSAN